MSDDFEGGKFEVVDDTEGPHECIKCGVEIPDEEYMGYHVCSKHWDYVQELTGCMASVTDNPYLITAGGVIFCGMPDDLEPETDLKCLPIFKQHPEEHHFYKFPLSALEQQLGLSGRQVEGRLSSLRQPTQTEEARYDCFVCGKQHTVVVEKRRD